MWSKREHGHMYKHKNTAMEDGTRVEGIDLRGQMGHRGNTMGFAGGGLDQLHMYVEFSIGLC